MKISTTVSKETNNEKNLLDTFDEITQQIDKVYEVRKMINNEKIRDELFYLVDELSEKRARVLDDIIYHISKSCGCNYTLEM